MKQDILEEQSEKFLEADPQQELEKLSWEFLLKEKEEDNESRKQENKKTREPEKEEAILDELGVYYNQQSSTRNQNFDFWNQNDELNINNLRRDSGIIFNEEKLQAHRVVEWTKAPKLRETKWKLFWSGLGRVMAWPLKAVLTIMVGTTTVVGKMVIGLGKLLYQCVKWPAILSVEIALAFRSVFIYIFGDFSWLISREGEPVLAVANELEVFEDRKITRDRRRLHPALAFAVVAFLLILPLQAYLFYNRAEKIKGEVLGASKAGVGHLLEAGAAGKEMDLESVSREFILAGEEFASAQARFKDLGLAANSASAVVPDVKAGKQLLEVAVKSAEVGQLLAKTGKALGGFAETIDYKQVTAVLDDDLLKVKSSGADEPFDWQGLNNDLNSAIAKAEEIEELLPEIKLDNTALTTYKEQIESVKIQMPSMIGWLQNYRDLTQIAMELLGVDEPRRWLFVFQNNTEMRPTGGFMGSYAVVDIDQGKIKKIEVPGGGFYDLKGSLAVMVDAPYPFHVFSPIWQPWNANWFPDWPASAEKIMWFYDKSGGPSVDGVISFTPDVLINLLELTGPIEMPEYGVTVESGNFTRVAQIEVEFDYDKVENKPKKFIGDLLPKVLDKTFTLTGENKIGALEAFLKSLETKDVLVYFKKTASQARVDDLGWSGRLKQYDKDYLAVIHTNIAGGKTDKVVTNKIEHKVEIMPDGQIVDTVILTKEHQGMADDIFEGQTNIDYVRFYVPQNSKLLAATGFDDLPAGRQFLTATSGVEVDPDLAKYENNTRIDEETGMRIVDEFGKTSFGNWVIVAPGQTKKMTIKYLLPWRLNQAKEEEEQKTDIWSLLKQYFRGNKTEEKPKGDFVYGLLVQKQSGSGADKYEGTLEADDHWSIGSYLPESGIAGENNSLKIDWSLEVDKYYGVEIKEK